MKVLFELIINFIKSLFKKEEISTNSNSNETSNTQGNNNVSTNTNNMQNSYNGKIIILDNGHARSTAGKKSPILSDGRRFYEYEFNRDIVRRVAQKLDTLGVNYYVIVPEVEEDIKLSVRANRANNICNKYGAGKCVLISVHSNAAGNGSEWMNARGWSVYTTKGVTNSDAIATTFWNEANKLLPKYNMKMRKDMQDGDPDYEENFTIIYKALCPAILTENLFYDNKTDVEFLLSEEGRDVIADIHVNAIKKICNIQ